eukprot:scaffold129201_cov63-Phaeocystis_antarctica.AAC.2
MPLIHLDGECPLGELRDALAHVAIPRSRRPREASVWDRDRPRPTRRPAARGRVKTQLSSWVDRSGRESPAALQPVAGSERKHDAWLARVARYQNLLAYCRNPFRAFGCVASAD